MKVHTLRLCCRVWQLASGVDPGFPKGSANPIGRWEANYYFGQNFMKIFDRGEGRFKKSRMNCKKTPHLFWMIKCK